MAYNRGTLDRATYGSLGSSVGCLDGVPFRITAQFKPPPQVILPPELESRGQHSAVSNEYLFDTEEAVLAWARAREEMAKARSVAATEAVGEAIEQFAQSPRHLPATSSDSDSEEMESEASKAGQTEAAAPVTRNSNALPRPITATLYDNILTPTPIHSAQPHPVSEGADKAASGLDLALFEKEDDPFDNLVLKTLDDMAELQTVLGSSSSSSQVPGNEAEPIYQNTEESNKNSSNSYVMEEEELCVDDLDTPLQEPEEAEAETTTPGGETTDLKRPLPELPSQTEHQTQDSGQGPGASQNALPLIEEGDYVQIRQDYRKEASVAFCRSEVGSESGDGSGSGGEMNGVAASPPVLGGQLPPNLAASKSYRAVLPPIPLPRHSRSPAVGVPLQNGTAGVALDRRMESDGRVRKSSTERESAVGAAGVPAPGTGRNRYSRHSVGVELVSDGEGGGAGCGALSELRNAQSSPDLCHEHRRERAASLDQVGPLSWQGPVDRSHSPIRHQSPVPPPRHSPLPSLPVPGRSSPQPTAATPSPPPRPSSQQAWNRYRPLPPPPATEGSLESNGPTGSSVPAMPPLYASVAPRIPKTFSNATQHGSATPPPYSASPPPYSALPPASAVPSGDMAVLPGYSPAADLGPDPYSAMSAETRNFVDSLVSMGFSKPRVIRAVEKLGLDAKEVTDHLFNVDKLVEKGYSPHLVETALHLYDNDLLKAERYLAMFKQFQELGFGADKIKEALVTNDMDRDKALDFLTA